MFRAYVAVRKRCGSYEITWKLRDYVKGRNFYVEVRNIFVVVKSLDVADCEETVRVSEESVRGS